MVSKKNKKRASSPTGGEAPAKAAAAPATLERAAEGNDEMGEFEDMWEDEFEEDGEDGGEVVDAGGSGSDEDDDDEDVRMEEDEAQGQEEARAPSPEAWLPGTRQLAADEFLQPDLSTYPLLHSFVPTWPSLSFDILRDAAGQERRGYPVECCLVAGTQAGDRTADEVTVMRWEGLSKTRKDELDMDDDSDEEDDDDDADADPVLTFKSIPHSGGVNRIRARPLPTPLSSGPPSGNEAYHVATFAETGKVHIFDVAPHLNSLLHPEQGSRELPKKPLFTIESHGRTEGFALDWQPGKFQSASVGLLSGDLHSKIFLTTITESSFVPSSRPFTSHTSSIEDLQWSPSEATVFASCSADRSIRIWDTRTKDRKSVLAMDGSHESDVNVISWNQGTEYLLLSGGDEGGLKVWDLRALKPSKTATPAPSPVAHFTWHTAPITSVSWHPTDHSCFAATGADDQLTLWDLSVEADADEQPTLTSKGGVQVPGQLMFVHQGQKELKEVRWHQQVPGVVVSTALDGFNIFKALPFA